ncbi:alpha/beta-hydrolase [Xylariaceae sp. FL0255]|nr:alpha/beta-hydrolase [Xylariaceae sp. FL0255]
MKEQDVVANPPSWPSRVYQSAFRKNRPTEAKLENESSGTDVEAAKAESPSLSAWERRLPRIFQQPGVSKRKRRIRCILVLAFILIAIAAILLGVLLTRARKAASSKPAYLYLQQGNYMGKIIEASDDYPRALEGFEGVPYAQSTAFQNRFRPPRALTTTNATGQMTNAQSYGLSCPQSNGSSSTQGENCLNVNIYRPHWGDTEEEAHAALRKNGLNSSSLLPVVAYIPGGGFNTGSGKERNMASLAAWSETPIIAVSFNYRLGALGFLPSSLSAKEGALNIGLKDQQFFLEWLRTNLPTIGGDPNNVTLSGQSAGAHSVGHHLISYSAANTLISSPPPFQKAILESGASTARSVYVPDHSLHEDQFQDFIEACGFENVPEDQIFDSLRNASYDKIVDAGYKIWTKYESSLKWAFQPCIDGEGGVIPDLPVESWRKGNVLRIPILTGFNTDEGAIFVPKGENDPDTVHDIMSSIIPALNTTSLNMITDTLYPNTDSTAGKSLYDNSDDASGFGTQFWPLEDAYGSYAYIAPVLQTAHYASTASDAAPVYVYHFAARSAKYGAADHGDETKFVIHDVVSLDEYQGLNDTANVMAGAWSRFIVTGDPNPSSTSLTTSDNSTQFTWPQYFSPFTGTGAANTSDTAGLVALFGEGNDEAMGSKGTQNPGIPAQSVKLDKRHKEEVLFWWPLAIYSEGYANGSLSI